MRRAILAALPLLALAAVAGSAAARAAQPTVTRAPLQAAAARVQRQVGDVRQHGLVLGSSRAPVEIIEYANLACDTCARIHRSVIPALIARYVRRGVARLELRIVADSPSSAALALGAYAASSQGRGWEFVQLAYLRRLPAPENGETPAELAGALGLARKRFRSDLTRPEWILNLKAAASVLAVAGFRGDPVFLLHRPGRTFTVLTEPASLRQFTEAIVAVQRGGA